MAKALKPRPAKKATDVQPVVVEEPVGRYINPLTDFGFKHIFGTKEFLLDFLNAVLDIEGGIVDLHYDNTERPGRSEDDRTTIFDLYCTLGNGERILIEMQHHRQKHFQDRTLYYASRLIQEQGEDKKGDTHWEFELNPVYSVNIVSFPLDVVVDVDVDTDTVTKKGKAKKRPVGKYASYVQLFDRDTLKVFYKKLTFVFLELPYFTKETHELTDYVDWWMYVLKNLAKLNDLPDALRNRIFERLFLKAEVAKLSKENRKKYDQSLKKLRDMNIILAQKNREIAESNILLAQKNREIAESSILLVQKNREIADISMVVTQRDRTIAERDIIIATLSNDKKALSKDYTMLSKDYTTLSKDHAAQAKKIAELERQLGLKSQEKLTN